MTKYSFLTRANVSGLGGGVGAPGRTDGPTRGHGGELA